MSETKNSSTDGLQPVSAEQPSPSESQGSGPLLGYPVTDVGDGRIIVQLGSASAPSNAASSASAPEDELVHRESKFGTPAMTRKQWTQLDERLLQMIRILRPQFDRVDSVRSLLSSGADANAKSPEGVTALHWACWQNHPEVVQLLIVHGAQLEARSPLDQTPLHWAAISGSVPCIKYLLSAGANLFAQDQCHLQVLHFAAQYDKLAAADYLIMMGADLEARTNKGSFFLFI